MNPGLLYDIEKGSHMAIDLISIELHEELFFKISKLVYRIAGINLPKTKILNLFHHD